MRKQFELLSPAGDFECLKAAVWGGCDAVYLGGNKFNARGNAGNFDNDNIKKAVSFCRLFGVAVYITLNTLVYDKNISEILEYVSFLEDEVKPDAYIIQDIGLMALIHERYPDAVIHASTQCAIHSAHSVDIYKSLGVSRIVGAREMTYDDIKSLSEKIEVEMFVHGALCVSQSGGCLFSSMVAKNSGNQGRCAQPCRLPFKAKNEYSLSLRDLSLSSCFTKVLQSGATSFKIEGRMKDPKYVFGVTSVFRRLIDEKRNATKDELRFLGDLFTRSGFTDGYFHGKVSKEMFGRRTDEDKKRTSSVELEIVTKKLACDAHCVITRNAPMMLTLSYGDISTTVFGAYPNEAISIPSDFEAVKKQISKMGATDFTLDSLTCDIEPKLNASPSELNKMRREAIEKLSAAIIESNTPKRCGRVPAIIKKGSSVSAEAYDVYRIYSPFLPKGLDESLARYIDIPIQNESIWKMFNASKLRLILPRVILLADEEKINSLLSEAKSYGVKDIIVQNLSHLSYCEGFNVHASLSPAPTNSASMRILAQFFKTIELSPEMTENAIARLEKPIPCEAIVYGRIPLMHTMTCIIESMNCGECRRERNGICTTKLIDRTGEAFPIIREFGHRTVIFNSHPTYLADKSERLDRCGVGGRIFVFTDEKEFSLSCLPNKYTRGYF